MLKKKKPFLKLFSATRGDLKVKFIFSVLVVFVAAGLIISSVSCNGHKKSSHDRLDKLSKTWAQSPRLKLTTEYDSKEDAFVSKGSYQVFENRQAGSGRMLELKIMILHAVDSQPEPDPIFILRGGPGVPAVDTYAGLLFPWMRQKRDVVLVNQRGTGGTNELQCKLPGNDDNIQGYLEPFFDTEVFRRELEELKKKADLRMYSTFNAMDDLNEIREALGYEKINLVGYSYGTRAALIYIKLHPGTVRSATLNGVAPTAFINPLYHAPAGQEAIEGLFAECAADPKCNGAFPDLPGKLATILQRLEAEPAEATVKHPVTGKPEKVKLSREAFATSLRFMMYSIPGNRQVPRLIQQAYEGDFSPFAQVAMESGRGLRMMIRFGQLLCVTCAEDVAQITPDEVERVTAGTFLGDVRVRGQMEICEFWPKSILPPGFSDPVTSDVPVLLLSGTQDPVTPPRWAEEAARHLSHSLHVIVPGPHGVGGACINSIMQEFLDKGSVDGIDTSCTADEKLPPFALPGK